MSELDDLAKKLSERKEINDKETFRVIEDFPPKTHSTFDLLIEEAVSKGNSNVRSTYYLDQTERVLVQVYYHKIMKASSFFFTYLFKALLVGKKIKNLWKIQVEIEASSLSPRWKNLLIKLAEYRKFLVALNESYLVPKKFHWVPVRR